MSKIETTAEGPKIKQKRVEMNNTAFGLVKQNNVWQLVKIKFDLDSGQLGDVSLVEMEDLAYGLERVNVELEQELVNNGA